MSRLDVAKQRLRAHGEHHLRVAAMEELRARHPAGTTAPYHERGALFWRYVFLPLYRRIPWPLKQRAMHALRMTAEHNGWTPPPRRPAEPWRPPAQAGTDASSRSSR
jgi:hypothetical protein